MTRRRSKPAKGTPARALLAGGLNRAMFAPQPKDVARDSMATVYECLTCLGSGRVRDGDTAEPRRCLDCGGAGTR